MANIVTMLNEMRQDGTIQRLATDAAAQFGTRTRRYIGSELLPERPVTANDYVEESIQYRTIVANAGTRYSPSQKKGGAIVGNFPVHLAHQDIASELTSQDYDAIVRALKGAAAFQGPLVQNQPGMQAVAQTTNWLDTTVVRALIEVIEVYRWQAIVSGVVNLVGDNAYNDTVTYPTFADLRAAAGGNWSDNTYDPFTDIAARVQAMSNRGIQPARFIMGRQAANKLLNNTLVRTRVGRAVMSPTGQVKGTIGAATLDEVNRALQADGIPPIELYDLMYQTELGSKFFLARDVAVLVGASGVDERIDLGGGQFETVENTIGYVGVGIATGQATPGRFVRMEHKENKPPRIEAEGWQTALPVITQPEAFAVISAIA